MHESKTVKQELENLKQKGYFRIWNGKEFIDLNQHYDEKKINLKDVKVLVDRLVYSKDDDEQRQRIADSLEQAFAEGDGYLSVMVENSSPADKTHPGSNEPPLSRGEYNIFSFNRHLEADGIRFEDPEPLMFSSLLDSMSQMATHRPQKPMGLQEPSFCQRD